MSSKLIVVANILAKAGKEEELKALLSTIVTETRKERGCIDYHFYRSQADPRQFISIEAWASIDAMQAHLGTSHVTAALAQKEELMESLTVHPLHEI